ncbi:MAG: methyl-accepting chemotaxis protein, partial [Methylotenera sp.]|nr:methyl-accepting chemotaxis protein [Methylotenera sp.]
NSAITSMDEVTQQNAALVEQAAAAAESLVDQAVGLMDTVSAFKLSGTAYKGNSNARTLARPATPKYASKASSAKPNAKSTPKLSAKASSDDGDWEEF